jgi:putative holliday junction resolvase
MRTLAIDFGTRRVGLALSDEGGRLATPYDVMQVNSPEQAIGLIAAVIEKQGVERIVVGLPLNMDGTLGPAARDTIAWARRLPQTTGALLIFVDERLSTFAAEQQLTDRKRAGERLTRKRKRQQLDALAAAAFLQAWLDGKAAEIPVSS